MLDRRPVEAAFGVSLGKTSTLFNNSRARASET
jgi:hypothetical protein